MATIAQLKTRIANVHGKVVTDFVLNEEDMLLVALNNARLFAEQSHDLENCYGAMDLVVDEVAGGDLDAVYLHGDTESPLKVKTIDDMGYYDDSGVFCPRRWQRMRQKRQQDARRKELGSFDDLEDRVPSDAEWSANHSRNCGIYVYGRQVYSMLAGGTSGTTKVVGIEGQFWLPEYVDDPEEEPEDGPYQDIFLAHGFNYLFWQGVCELNYIFRKFAPRQEGNVPAPTREAQAALGAFLTWDSYAQVEGRKR